MPEWNQMVTSVVHHVKLDFIKQSAVKIIVSNVQWEHQQVQQAVQVKISVCVSNLDTVSAINVDNYMLLL